MISPRLKYLFERYFEKTASDQERSELIALLQDSGPGKGQEDLESDADLRELISQAYDRQITYPPFPAQSADLILHNILQITGKPSEPKHRSVIVRAISYRRRVVAAAAIVFLSTGGYYWWQVSHQQGSVKNLTTGAAFKNDMAPGHEGAILTLANGATVLLDSANNGSLATEGTTELVKQDGELTYTAPKDPRETLYNTMTTPRGRQYRLVLADGSKVWLNSASSIRYPTSFTGNKREVELTGEGYFEIQDNAAQPFLVKTKKMDVHVLGTGFNVMAYEDEDAVRTTLIHGSVKVQAGNSSALITPGQQASLPEGNTQVSLSTPDMTEVLAWKEDKFRFKSTGIKTIMRQLARWYDVRVVYKGEIPDVKLSGVFPRREYASQLLEVLEEAGKIHFTMEGKTITVMAAEK